MMYRSSSLPRRVVSTVSRRHAHYSPVPEVPEGLEGLEGGKSSAIAVFEAQKPVVWRGLASAWPAMGWGDLEGLRERVGQHVVPVELGESYMDPSLQTVHLDMADLLAFVSKFMHEPPSQHDAPSVYLAQHELFTTIPSLRGDIRTPPFIGEVGGEVYQTNGWVGPCGTYSPCHTDPYHNVLVQVVGKKHVRLFGPHNSACMYPHQGRQRNTSQVDPREEEAALRARFPLFEGVEGEEVVLQPGDALFIPKKWWHFCHSLTGSISVNYWW